MHEICAHLNSPKSTVFHAFIIPRYHPLIGKKNQWGHTIYSILCSREFQISIIFSVMGTFTKKVMLQNLF